MPIFPANTDYSDKDFESVLARLQNVIQSVFPDWTDFNRANFGNILLESFAFVMDVSLFYQDAESREARIVTARLRRNLLGLTKLINFTPRSASAASTDVILTITKPDGVTAPDNPVEFLRGQLFSTKEITSALDFQLLEDFTHPGLSTSSQLSVENSTFVADVFQSNDLANQEFELSRAPFIDDSVGDGTGGSGQVVAGNGDYTVVDSFLASSSSDRHVVIIANERELATLRFGNGVNGAIPTGTITAEYKVGGGAAGNVEANTINKVQQAYTDTFGNPVLVTVNNALAASGGADRETNASIRQRAPETLRVLNRAVAREDFEIVSKQVSGVARALMLSSNEDVAVEENTGDLYIIPEGGGVPSTTLKQSVLDQFEGSSAPFPKTLTFQIEVLDPVYLTINVQSTVYLRANVTASVAKAAIEANLAAFFALDAADGAENTEVNFGFNYKDADGDPAGEIVLSDIFNVVRDTTGVRKIGDLTSDFQLNGEHRDVVIALKEFPELGTITLINGDTGLPL